MHYDITLDFGNDRSYTYGVDAERTPEAVDAAHQWLDQQYLELGCEPLRPTGKVLNADKVLVVAIEGGEKRFAEGGEWARAYALHAAMALNRALVRINVVDRVVGY